MNSKLRYKWKHGRRSTGCRYGQMPPHILRSGAKAMARGGQGERGGHLTTFGVP